MKAGAAALLTKPALFTSKLLAQAGAPVTRATAVMRNRNYEDLIAFQGVHNRIEKAVDRPSTDVKSNRMSRARMIDHELSSRLDSVDKAVTVAASLALQVSSGFNEFGLSLVVQFA